MNVPNHIAIILDGNGRWAKKRGMPRGYGHVKGCENLETICEVAKDLGVKYLTVYAFSTENWKRSKEEVDGLMRLFRSYLKKCLKIAKKNDMCVRVIGDYSAFDAVRASKNCRSFPKISKRCISRLRSTTEAGMRSCGRSTACCGMKRTERSPAR